MFITVLGKGNNHGIDNGLSLTLCLSLFGSDRFDLDKRGGIVSNTIYLSAFAMWGVNGTSMRFVPSSSEPFSLDMVPWSLASPGYPRSVPPTPPKLSPTDSPDGGSEGSDKIDGWKVAIIVVGAVLIAAVIAAVVMAVMWLRGGLRHCCFPKALKDTAVLSPASHRADNADRIPFRVISNNDGATIDSPTATGGIPQRTATNNGVIILLPSETSMDRHSGLLNAAIQQLNMRNGRWPGLCQNYQAGWG